MTGWWISDLWTQPHGNVWVVSWLVWVIASITLHELGHGWAAIRLGDDTPVRAGHMTWNPMVHMGLYSFIVLALIGIAWGAMPVDPSRLRGKHGDTLVTLAGPAVNLVLAVICFVLFLFWLPLADGSINPNWVIEEPLRTNLNIFLGIGAQLNVVLLLLNLLPVPPLDGGRIAMNLVPSFRRLLGSENGQWIALGMFILLFVFGAQLLFAVSNTIVFDLSSIIRDAVFA